VLRIDSKYNDALYHSDDVIYFSDNGESACIGSSNMNVCDDNTPQFYYNYVASEFIGTRKSANTEGGNDYTLPGTCYGIAHTGIKDEKGDTLRVQITPDNVYENPQIKEINGERPAPTTFVLTV